MFLLPEYTPQVVVEIVKFWPFSAAHVAELIATFRVAGIPQQPHAQQLELDEDETDETLETLEALETLDALDMLDVLDRLDVLD